MDSKRLNPVIDPGIKGKYPHVEVKTVDGQLTEITYIDRVTVVSRPVDKVPKHVAEPQIQP